MKKRNVHSPIMAHVKKAAREGRGTRVLEMKGPRGGRLVPGDGYYIAEDGSIRKKGEK